MQITAHTYTQIRNKKQATEWVDGWMDGWIHNKVKREGKYSLESTDPRESEFAPTCVRNSLLSYLSITYLLICWFIYIGKFAGLRRFWTVKSTPG